MALRDPLVTRARFDATVVNMARDSKDDLKGLIRAAFRDALKGDGTGVREAHALDAYATADGQAAARALDVETHWWELPEGLRGHLGTALSFTDEIGFRFILPAAMTADIDGVSWMDSSVFFHLCLVHPERRAPHHGHPEYVAYLRDLDPRQHAAWRGFTSAQIHAIAEYFRWWMRKEGSYLEADRNAEIVSVRRSHASSREHARPGDYTLSADDAIAVFDEECRILREWLQIGAAAGAN